MVPLPRKSAAPTGAFAGRAGDDAWVAAFHRGESPAIEDCYRDHFATVADAVRGVLDSADRETIIHEVFSRLIAGEDLRRSFRGGSLAAWLTVVARNHAIDYRRRRARETALPAAIGEAQADSSEETTEARMLLERFRSEHVPPGWAGVFELCFLRQMSQRDAARVLGIGRSTLAYRELRLRRRLRRFLLEDETP